MAIKDYQEKIKKKMSLDEVFSDSSTVNDHLPKVAIDSQKKALELNVENKKESTTAAQYQLPKGNKYSRRMTLNLTEKAYVHFNEIYGKRFVDGNPTEKGDLICEAIELLFAREMHNNSI